MFNKIKKIVLVILIPIFSLSQELDLEINDLGIFSNSEKKIISNKNFNNNATTYTYTILMDKNHRLSLVREAFNVYKTQCYMPLTKENNNYYAEYVNCITINIKNGINPEWITTVKKFKKDKIKNLNIEDCFTNNSNIKTIQSINDKNHLLFRNVPRYRDSEVVYETHIYDIDNIENNFVFISLFPNIKSYISKPILTKKQPLYKVPPIKTKMYLIKGDKVEILEEKDDWLYILYRGKKDIKAWIPKSSVE